LAIYQRRRRRQSQSTSHDLKLCTCDTFSMLGLAFNFLAYLFQSSARIGGFATASWIDPQLATESRQSTKCQNRLNIMPGAGIY